MEVLHDGFFQSFRHTLCGLKCMYEIRGKSCMLQLIRTCEELRVTAQHRPTAGSFNN